MSSNFDNQLGRVAKRDMRLKPSVMSPLPLHHPLPPRPPRPVNSLNHAPDPVKQTPFVNSNPALPARPTTILQPDHRSYQNGGRAVLPQPQNYINPSFYINGPADFNYKHVAGELRAHEKPKHAAANPKCSTTSGNSNARIGKHHTSPPAENCNIQYSTPYLDAIRPMTQMMEKELRESANTGFASLATQKKLRESVKSVDESFKSVDASQKLSMDESVAQPDRPGYATKEESHKFVASQPRESQVRESNTSSSSAPTYEPKIIQLNYTLKKMYHPDPTESFPRALLVADHDDNAKLAAVRRDEEIRAAKEKYLALIKDLDDKYEKDLTKLDREVKVRQEEHEKFKTTLAELNALVGKHGGRQFQPSDFAPKPPISAPDSTVAAREPSLTKPFISFQLPPANHAREAHDNPNSQVSQTATRVLANTSSLAIFYDAIEQPYSPSLFVTPDCEEGTSKEAERSVSMPFNSEAKSSQEHTTKSTSSFHSDADFSQALTIAESSSSFNSDSLTSLKRKTQTSPLNPAKKVRPTTTSSPTPISSSATPPPTTPTPIPKSSPVSTPVPSYIETNHLRPKLTAYPYCFVSAWNIDVKNKNLPLLRKMVEESNYCVEAVKADKTGYFFIFESSEKGEQMAKACAEHFHSWRFRGEKLWMSFVERGRAVDE